MTRYVVKRLLEAIPALIGISMLSFLLLHIVPGDPVRILLGQHYTLQRAAILEKQLGLNLPLWKQYFVWLGEAVRGNFGYSYVYDKPVTQVVLQALPHTLLLVAGAILFAHLSAIFLGALQAYYAESKFDNLATAINYFFYSMPAYWLGIIIIIVFAIQLNWFPSGGISNPNSEHPSLADYAYHMVLPFVTLTLLSLAQWTRYMRSSMREALLQDYIRTARAKGMSEFRVLFFHALRNSVLPLITLLGLYLPGLFAGSLFVEEIFNYPGMGLLFWNATNDRDFPVLLAVIMFLGTITILGNLIADILYAIIDPRIEYGS